jgi:hypothetical protein
MMKAAKMVYKACERIRHWSYNESVFMKRGKRARTSVKIRK